MDQDYQSFLKCKTVTAPSVGIERPGKLNENLFGFQRDIAAWALARGSAAVFADTGLGKTFTQLEWAHKVARHTKGSVIILAPLAVGQQTAREAAKFGYKKVAYVREESEATGLEIAITNYERMQKFDVSRFSGVVLDESSLLKSFMGKTKQALVSAFKNHKFKLACTATPAPNDHLELGNHSEFLGVLSSHEMIARWFINDTESMGVYRLKGHAVTPFWNWVSSWSRMVGRPSDMGYSDDGFILPNLDIHRHIVSADLTQERGDLLFRIPELSATSYHREKRLTVAARAERIAQLVAAEPDESWVIWCDTDYEADALTTAIPNATEVRGSDSQEKKERAAIGFCEGAIKVLISKPSIFGFGLNWQHCARVAFIGPTYSYEAYYQAVRRCWRFGQKRPVQVHLAMADTEREVWNVLQRKAEDHEKMKTSMFAAMRRAQGVDVVRRVAYEATRAGTLPNWLVSLEKGVAA